MLSLIFKCQNEAFKKIRNEFLYRLNKLYSHPLLGNLLDTGDIDYCILDVLEQLYKYKKNFI